MERVVSATEARVHFGEMLRYVADEQEAIIIERGGKPEAVMISVELYEQYKVFQEEKPKWWELVLRSRARVAQELGDNKLPPSEEIIRQMREERDAYLRDLY